jgi:Na+-transporting methylmalonyl-CoA/oxaloacetate decarboxylase gamma subunit
VRPENETGVLTLLFALAVVLYGVTRLVAGPSAFPEVPAAVVPAEHVPSAESATRLANAVPAPR